MNWVYHTIEKRPVIAVPDALSTFENRTGDCNEHAMLLAALARASGIPAQIECGLAYLNGRFYYHAWNRLYVGRWITADAAFGQFPADVTHLRLTSGVHHMTDLVTVIGNIRIKTISLVPRNP
jgi:transglutaminase-like putative cysteine protease